VKRGFIAAALVLITGAGLSAQAYKAAETFDAVWSIVNDSHFDPSFDEAKWNAVAKELRPKAVEAKTPGELRAVLADMLARLGLSHFAVIPSSPDAPGEALNLSGEPGFDFRLIDQQIVVTHVDVGSPAAAAGVHAGWVVDKVGTTSLASTVQPAIEHAPPRLAQLQAWRVAATKLRGPAESIAEITFLDDRNAPVTRRIERREESGTPVKVGSLPTMFVRVDSEQKHTPAGRTVGVIGFNVWMTAVDAPFQKAIDTYRSADGIVLDLRGNPGGLAAMISGIAGHFIADRETLGVMKTKLPQPLHFAVNPRLVNAAGERVEPFKGPVAVIVDGMTGSASECFAGGMQSLGRVRVFGQTSMGQALPALFDKLPNGDLFIHAWGDFVTSTGVRVEGRGVVPDEPVALTRASLLDGHDAPMDAALAWIDRAKTGK
jgi:carboxyl-terminal processing protease